MPNTRLVQKNNLLSTTANKAGIKSIFNRLSNQETLRFLMCGQSNVGKNTLIKRLLEETNLLFHNQAPSVQLKKSPKLTPQTNELIARSIKNNDSVIAHHFFRTTKRAFIASDVSNESQNTKDIFIGASTANLAAIVVDCQLGLTDQTKAQIHLNTLLGVDHLVLIINKMDLVNFNKKKFSLIESEFLKILKPLIFKSATVIPLSALSGDNITVRSQRMPWYCGPTLMNYLEDALIYKHTEGVTIFPIQLVNKFTSNFTGFSGTLVQGEIQLGDDIIVTSSGQIAKVTAITTMDGQLKKAYPGMPITICLDQDINISRGDILSLSHQRLQTTDQFTATIIWMDQKNGMAGRHYDLKLNNQYVDCSILNVKHRINLETMAQEPAKLLKFNEITTCDISTTKPIVYTTFRESKELGSFILVDRVTHATVGAGLIEHNLRRAENIHRQALTITRIGREKLNGHKAKVIWFTGLSGSGKSTLANALELKLHNKKIRTYILDGDNIRHGLNKDLGFTDADRVENIRRIAEVAKLMMDAGLIVITAFISPFRQDRDMVRELIGSDNFIEVYVDAPLSICEQRDVKGLYKLAREAKIPNMTGINSPYEAPLNPEFIANSATESIEEIVSKLEKTLLNVKI